MSPAIPRILPFAAYLAFLACLSGMSVLADVLPDWKGWVSSVQLWHYPLKILVVSLLLGVFWPRYDELKDKLFRPTRDLGMACVVGVLVYVAWVRMDWSWATVGSAQGYNPFEAGRGGTWLAVARLFGASVVVPIMEELFWRSFLIRYLISPDFRSVPIGMYSPAAWAISIVLFGFEHYQWLAGIVAGLAYTLLWHYTRRLWPCIIAHAVTNLCLGIHVLVTEEWQWW